MDLTAINYLAVAVAAVISFGLGALWYSPVMFGKAWQKELGFSDEYLQSGNMGKIFGSSVILMLIMALGLAVLLNARWGDSVTLMSGIKHGLFVGVAFVGASMGINMLYQRKSLKLWLIDAGYQILFLLIMGAIIGAWH
jgi:hypothetical protein